MKKLILRTSVAVLFSLSASAKTPAEKAGDQVRRVKKGAQITLVRYREDMGAFELKIEGEPAVGPNYADPEELRKAVGLEGDTKSLLKKKDQMAGSIYSLKQPLLLLTENQALRLVKRKK